MEPKTPNTEQMEAMEIDETPRIVIGATNFMIFPDKLNNKPVHLSRDHLLWIGALMEVMAKAKAGAQSDTKG